MLGDSVCLTMKRLDPSPVDHFTSQLLNGVGKATGVKSQAESLLPFLEIESVIGGFWVSYP